MYSSCLQLFPVYVIVVDWCVQCIYVVVVVFTHVVLICLVPPSIYIYIYIFIYNGFLCNCVGVVLCTALRLAWCCALWCCHAAFNFVSRLNNAMRLKNARHVIWWRQSLPPRVWECTTRSFHGSREILPPPARRILYPPRRRVIFDYRCSIIATKKRLNV